MKSRILTCSTVITLFAALTMPVRLSAQHTRYKLINLGTLGGPLSYGSVNGDGFRLLNDVGVISSSADTSIPDPNAPNFCFNPDCFVAHAFRWKNGILTDLGALPGNNSSAVGAINARGWSTGQSQNGLFAPNGSPITHAALWKQREIVDLGTLSGGTLSLGGYINNGGQVVGISDNGVPDPFSLFFIGVQIRTFLWDHGVIQDIGTLGGPDAGAGAGCDNQRQGLIVGGSYTSFVPNPTTGIPTLDPFLWKDGKMVDLGNLGGTMSFAQCANNQGSVIGTSTLAGDALNHAFFWRGGVMTDLGTLGGDNSEAIWINGAGDVAGSADLPGSIIHDAVLWRHGVIHDLGTVAGDLCSRGRAINSRGQVTGGSSDCHTFQHAFVWEEGGPMLDLNTLIPPGSGLQLTNAFNINDRGEILARFVPIGAAHFDDEAFGIVLLIPCKPGQKEGCEANAGTATSMAPRTLVPTFKDSITATWDQPRLTPSKNIAAWQLRFAQRHHIPGTGAPMD